MNDHLPAHVLEELADILWQERHLVEALLYRLVVARLLLAADEHRFVAAAIDEVEDVVHALRRAERDRSDTLSAVAEHLEVPVDDLTLADIARRAPRSLQPVFADHREAFLALIAEIEQAAEANRHLASSALRRLQRLLGALTGVVPPAACRPALQLARAL